MKWYENLYLSDSVRKKEHRIREALEKGEFPERLWVISIPIGSSDQLDIRKASSLASHDLWGMIPMIVGLAKTKGEAVALVERMARDCLSSRGDAQLREFLTGKEA